MSFIWTIISFILIISVIVISHEFGHFIVGRLNGIEVKEFTVGMGPCIFKKQGEQTLFTIRLLPIGGACIFKGMDLEEDEEDIEPEDLVDDDDNASTKKEIVYEPGSFGAAPIWGRIATVLAGPFFNIVLAYLLAIFICWFCGQDLPVLYGVMEGYPAEEAELQKGDVILEVDNQKIFLWREINVISYMNYGKPLSITYERDGQIYNTVITPKYSEEDGRYYIGFLGGGEYVMCNNLSVFKYSLLEIRYWFITTYRSIWYLFTGHGSIDDLSGPVGVANVIDETIEETKEYGVFTVILNMVNITVLLAVNLGVVNLLPLPALDGGRLLLLLFELITRRRVPPEKEGMFHLIGFILLFGLMIVVLFNDITKIFR